MYISSPHEAIILIKHLYLNLVLSRNQICLETTQTRILVDLEVLVAVASSEGPLDRTQVAAWAALVASNRRTLWVEASDRMLRPVVVHLAEVSNSQRSLQGLVRILHLRVWEVDSVELARVALASPVDKHQVASAELAIRPQALEATASGTAAGSTRRVWWRWLRWKQAGWPFWPERPGCSQPSAEHHFVRLWSCGRGRIRLRTTERHPGWLLRAKHPRPIWQPEQRRWFRWIWRSRRRWKQILRNWVRPTTE